jgi:glycosyltransferase involved in cell wall biosynthesis
VSTKAGAGQITVDMVLAEAIDARSGIGRYAAELSSALSDLGVCLDLPRFRYLPFARNRAILQTLPIGVQSPRSGQVYHLPNSRSAAVLLMNRGVRPAVVTVHDIGGLYNPADRPLGTRVGRTLLRLAWQGMRRADRIIAVSNFTRQGLIDHGFDPGKIVTIHEGVDHDRFRPIPDAADRVATKYGIDFSSRPTILYVGNEFPRKNLAMLVDSVAILKRRGTRVQLVKVGAAGYGPGRAELKNAITRNGLTADVHFVERVPDDDLPYFYAAATVYIQPSTWEGFGLPVLEAMACGTPVVASDAAALPEVCADAAILVPPKNAEGFADAIGETLTDPARACDLSARGRYRAKAFTWERTAIQTLELYMSMLKREG